MTTMRFVSAKLPATRRYMYTPLDKREPSSRVAVKAGFHLPARQPCYTPAEHIVDIERHLCRFFGWQFIR